MKHPRWDPTLNPRWDPANPAWNHQRAPTFIPGGIPPQNKTASTFGDNGSLMQHWKWLQVVDHKTKQKQTKKQTNKEKQVLKLQRRGDFAHFWYLNIQSHSKFFCAQNHKLPFTFHLKHSVAYHFISCLVCNFCSAGFILLYSAYM